MQPREGTHVQYQSGPQQGEARRSRRRCEAVGSQAAPRPSLFVQPLQNGAPNNVRGVTSARSALAPVRPSSQALCLNSASRAHPWCIIGAFYAPAKRRASTGALLDVQALDHLALPPPLAARATCVLRSAPPHPALVSLLPFAASQPTSTLSHGTAVTWHLQWLARGGVSVDDPSAPRRLWAAGRLEVNRGGKETKRDPSTRNSVLLTPGIDAAGRNYPWRHLGWVSGCSGALIVVLPSPLACLIRISPQRTAVRSRVLQRTRGAILERGLPGLAAFPARETPGLV